MTHIVINTCYGGFSLSEEAVLWYAGTKGLKISPEKGPYSFTTYWTVPPEERVKDPPKKVWVAMPLEERQAHSRLSESQYFSSRNIPRDDPVLVQTVMQLGAKADGAQAKLKVVEIPDDVEWHIEEHDGNEHVAENHRTWY